MGKCEHNVNSSNRLFVMMEMNIVFVLKEPYGHCPRSGVELGIETPTRSGGRMRESAAGGRATTNLALLGPDPPGRQRRGGVGLRDLDRAVGCDVAVAH